MNIICIESFCLQKTHNRTLLLGSTLLKHGRHFDYWNQPLYMRIHVCYLDCHEAGLCCYLMIQIKTITSITAVLFPFYFLTLPRTLQEICLLTHVMIWIHSIHKVHNGRIWGSYSGDCEDWWYLGYDVMYFGLNWLTFRRKLLPPSSGSKSINEPKNNKAIPVAVLGGP
jgi:hypothetical protein